MAPSIRKPEAVRALRLALDAAGFTFENVKHALNADDNLNTPPQQAPLVAQKLGDRPLATFIRLFVVAASATEQEARRALAPLELADAVAMGVVGLSRSRVHPTIRITPVDGLFFASDLEPPGPADDVPADYVMGIADSSRMLARLTIRRPVERALDLGTGCGYHALLAARHAEHVIAADINPRALAFAAFNALLNGMPNVECRQGDRFGSVAGLDFDLIVTNPPFVISPDRATLYRDSGLGADRVSQIIVQEAALHLRPEGTAHILMSWIHTPDGDWSQPLRAWVADSGCDAWFIRQASYDPLAYAIWWNQRLALDSKMTRYIDAVDRWLRYYEQLGITAMGYGATLLRRRQAERHRVRLDDAPQGGIGPGAADDLAHLWEVEDYLDDVDDAKLLQHRIGVAPGHRMEQTLQWRNGAFRTVDATLVREQGLQPRAEVDAPMAVLLTHIDGERTIAEVIEQTASVINAPSWDTFRADTLVVMRELILHGFLQLH
jgi:methylase of polypeptide subunit release factors